MNARYLQYMQLLQQNDTSYFHTGIEQVGFLCHSENSFWFQPLRSQTANNGQCG